jgi:hypothetical protein
MPAYDRLIAGIQVLEIPAAGSPINVPTSFGIVTIGYERPCKRQPINTSWNQCFRNPAFCPGMGMSDVIPVTACNRGVTQVTSQRD